MSDKLKQPIAWNSGGVQQKMKSSGLPGSTDESKSAAGRFATLSDPVVADECWHDVFEEELTVTLTSRATKYCRSHLQVFQHLCVRLGQEASVPVGCKDRQIKVSGSSEYLAEFSRQIHSEPSDLKDLTVSFAYDDACTRASGQNPSLSPIPRRSALEEEGFVESQTDVEELMTPSASLAANANYSPSLHKRPSGQSSHQKSPPATAQSLNQQSSEVQSENQKLQLAEKAKKAMRKNSDPESLSPTRSRPPPEADASSVSQKDVDDLTTPSDVANSNRSLFLGKQSETKSQNQKSQPSAQQKETSSQERQLHQRKTGTSWELSAVRSAPSESAKGIRSSDRGSSPAAGVPSGKPKSGDKEEDSCAICIGSITNRKALPCGHAFCSPCIDQWFKQKPSCPNCFKTFGKVTGNQPAGGTMHHSTRSSSLPGFRDCGTIEINYHIPSGRQTDKHPNPGQPYGGTSRTAYLPDNTEGRKVLGLLKKAFDARLTFTVGTSRTTGAQNQVTWNDIHHKTSAHGGAFGYPDKTYLERVMGELKDKGIE
eukprot:m.178455 g.178455  ORF g.178455 m.178455 type:complete len:541 (+) comp39174_c0_seq10:148-1770(+)